MCILTFLQITSAQENEEEEEDDLLEYLTKSIGIPNGGLKGIFSYARSVALESGLNSDFIVYALHGNNTCIRKLPCSRLETGTLGVCFAPLRIVGYLAYVLYSATIGLIVAPLEFFFPYLPCIDTNPVTVPLQSDKTFALVWCEALHVITNAILRVFVVVYISLVMVT